MLIFELPAITGNRIWITKAKILHFYFEVFFWGGNDCTRFLRKKNVAKTSRTIALNPYGEKFLFTTSTQANRK